MVKIYEVRMTRGKEAQSVYFKDVYLADAYMHAMKETIAKIVETNDVVFQGYCFDAFETQEEVIDDVRRQFKEALGAIDIEALGVINAEA